LQTAVIVAGPVIAAQAVQHESKTVPIVMSGGAGARQTGLIASLARPGANVTGVTNQGDDLTEKLFETINAIAPKAKRIGVLNSGKAVVHVEVWNGAHKAARAFGMTLVDLRAATAAEVWQLAALAKRERCEALVVALDPFLFNVRPESSRWSTRCICPARTSARNLSKKAVWSAIRPMRAIRIGARRTTWCASSKAPSRPTCRWSSRTGLNWCSISRPPRSWGSSFRKPFWCVPTG